MVIVTQKKDALASMPQFPEHKIHLTGGQKYLIPDPLVYWNSPFEKCSKAQFENFHILAKQKRNARVLFFRSESGLGDIVSTWPFVSLLNDFGFHVDVLTFEAYRPLWQFPWINKVISFPMEWDDTYDHYCIFDSVTVEDESEEQENPTDIMLRRIGVDPAAILSDQKVIAPRFTAEELEAEKRMFGGEKRAVFTLGASHIIKSLPPKRGAEIFNALTEAFPDFYWLGLFDFNKNPDAFRTGLNSSRKNWQVYNAKTHRELLSVIKGAEVVVTPDSFAQHAAGSMQVPCVSMFGITDPKTYRYYKNRVTIHNVSACPHAPCNSRRFYDGDLFPPYCPTRNEKKCAALDAITPEQVIEAVKEVIACRL
jgi:ADP-heptose:LPS heptosyltransferase